MSSGEKRRHPRFRIEGVTMALGKPGLLADMGLGPIRHSVINLSQGGAMVRYTKKLDVDSRHEVRIEIPKFKQVIEAVGEVRWCGESARKETEIYLGIQFVDIAPEQLQKLSSVQELLASAESKAKAAPRKDASSRTLKPPRA